MKSGAEKDAQLPHFTEQVISRAGTPPVFQFLINLGNIQDDSYGGMSQGAKKGLEGWRYSKWGWLPIC